MRLMSRGNNVKLCDTSCKSAIKMPSLLLKHECQTQILLVSKSQAKLIELILSTQRDK